MRSYRTFTKESQNFGSVNKKERLEKRYEKLLDESNRRSHTKSVKIGKKAAEADQIRKQLDAMEANKG